MANLWTEFQPIAWIATTPTSQMRLLPLAQSSQGVLWCSPHLKSHPHCQIYAPSLREHLSIIWPHQRAIVFGLTLGAVVRLIAPLLTDKQQDPTILCIPESGEYVITVCGGHQQQGDKLSQSIAHLLGIKSVITDAATAHDIPGVDTWGMPWNWQKGAGNWTGIASAIIRDEPIHIMQESGTTLWRQMIMQKSNLIFLQEPDLQTKTIWITHREITSPDQQIVTWHPRVLWVGIGCERGTSQEQIDSAVKTVFATHQLSLKSIAGIASLDIKKDEIGLVNLTQAQGWPFLTFSAATLSQISVPNPSKIVAQTVGTASVAEASALQASQGTLLVPKTILSPVTIAVALAPQEWLNRPGQLYLVGIGPGDLAQLTPAARQAITQADVVIGYHLYLQLLDTIKRPAQIWEPYPIGQETQRAQRAIELAHWGLNVAVVSSGDCGIYGMAGVVIELLQKQDSVKTKLDIKIFPGISALQSAASRVGVPLMQDFCAISLSDLHVPWDVIAQRVTHAAQGDFVTIFYNPCSQQRTWQLPTAQAIFLQYRDPQTPVAIVRQAYRQDEQIWRDTLANFTQNSLDMFCTIIIGNSRTYWSEYGLITPRNYPPKSPHFDPQSQNLNSE
ncbi:precorrin-3B C17-methyltransferase [Gloeomargarita lithophora Alchichica-D10]|uniref:Precorrin-3B C17-methyltransferase n=1 Tax=Gloeomargarita lithophora Alchichica-D10 TaxID=1188229 RepID=A0A1J0AHC6_9CYAN|nr:precorrin-3B C(17)-methyltransferase [Gloeomargarita lithophora]APB35333.1 precorrin-3B C17-methyltransferase [Gloeomargarita lithophora Alchichica-D10]